MDQQLFGLLHPQIFDNIDMYIPCYTEKVIELTYYFIDPFHNTIEHGVLPLANIK